MRILEDSPAVRVLEDRGRIQGRNQEKESIAINMLRAGEDYNKISQFTGLTVERVAKLKEDSLAYA